MFKNTPTVFHWHGDRFDIPYGAYDIACSDANINQAFLYKDNVLALQFHLEVMEESVRAMVQHGEDELVPGKYIQPAEEILQGIKNVTRGNELMQIVLENFLCY